MLIGFSWTFIIYQIKEHHFIHLHDLKCCQVKYNRCTMHLLIYSVLLYSYFKHLSPPKSHTLKPHSCGFLFTAKHGWGYCSYTAKLAGANLLDAHIYQSLFLEIKILSESNTFLHFLHNLSIKIWIRFHTVFFLLFCIMYIQCLYILT